MKFRTRLDKQTKLELIESVQQLEREHDDCKKAIAIYEKGFESSCRERDEAREETEAVRSELNAQRKRRRELAREVERLNDDVDKLREKLEMRDNEIEAIKELHENQSHTIAVQIDEIEKLKREFDVDARDKLLDKIDLLEERNRTQADSIAQLDNELGLAKQYLAQISRVISQYKLTD